MRLIDYRAAVFVLLFALASCGGSEHPAPPLHSNGTLTPAGVIWSINQAEKNDGWIDAAQFTAVVEGVYISNGGQWYLHFDADYPNQSISAWWPKSYTEKKYKNWFLGLKGREVTISGKPRLYKGKPELVIHEVTQINLVETPLVPKSEPVPSEAPAKANSSLYRIDRKGNPEAALEDFVNRGKASGW